MLTPLHYRNYITVWPILFFLITLVSCGTINHRDNIIPIDSTPRHAKVFDEDKKFLGTTPFFYEINKERKQNFTFFENESKQEMKISYKCALNYSESLIPNLLISLLYPVGTTWGAISMAVDYWSGDLFTCAKGIEINIPNNLNNGPLKLSAKRILILPIESTDEKIASEIVALWKKNFFSIQTTDSIIPMAKANRSIITNGLSDKRLWAPREINRQDLWPLGHEFSATHLLSFEKKSEGEVTTYTPKLYDFFTLQEVQETYLKPLQINDTPENSLETLEIIKESVLQTIALIPNSISASLSFDRTILVADSSNQSVGIEGHRHPMAFPKFLSIWGAENMSHPYLYDSWDYNLQFSPAIALSAWEANLDYLTLQMQSAILGGKASINLHTPFGSLGMAIGMGYGYFYALGSDQEKFIFTEWPALVDIYYYKFLTSKLFFKFKVSSYGLDRKNPSIEWKGLRLDGWMEAGASLGHYFPTMKSTLRNLLP